ncbi:MAG TPA: AAA family ATPase, partial [Candidatus Alectryocaccobium stercorigallinarum]|nr:AAA family ATPase [Candidatus Alectryocaccobium stercorigallinarum]
MSVTTKEMILKVLDAFNPWWKTNSVRPSFIKKYKRLAFYKAMELINQPDIRRSIIITGIRRVGKTTIQYQMIDSLLKSGIPPQKIVFISLDHPILKLSAFNDILECYHENIYAEQDVYYF